MRELNKIDTTFWKQKAIYPILAALLLRSCWALTIPIIPVSDSVAYDVFAWNIARGMGYGWTVDAPTAYWPVGTSAIYGGVFWLFGHDYFPVAILQVLIGTLIVVLSIALAKRWFDYRVAILSGWILACWPLLIQYTTILASEMYFVFFTLLALWLAGRESTSTASKIADGALAGVALAAASYVRPLALIMAPLLYIAPFLKRNEQRYALASCAVAIVAMCVCIAPWTYRNWRVFDRVVVISTNGGSNLWMGNNPSGSVEYMPLPNVGISNEADKDEYFARQARNFIVSNPSAFLGRTAKKIVALHDRETIGVTWNEKGIHMRFGMSSILTILKGISTLWWWGVLVLAIIGIASIARTGALLNSPPTYFWIYFSVVHGASVAGDRYHVPSIPFIAMLASIAIVSIVSMRKAGRQTNSRCLST